MSGTVTLVFRCEWPGTELVQTVNIDSLLKSTFRELVEDFCDSQMNACQLNDQPGPSGYSDRVRFEASLYLGNLLFDYGKLCFDQCVSGKTLETLGVSPDEDNQVVFIVRYVRAPIVTP